MENIVKRLEKIGIVTIQQIADMPIKKFIKIGLSESEANRLIRCARYALI